MSNALNDFVVAAGSYFGLPEGRVVQGSTVDVSNGDMELVLRIVLTTDDVVGIGKRMGVMMVEAQVDAARAPQAEPEGPTRDQLRAQWNSLPASQRSAFGSFHKFKAACEQAGAEWPLGERKAELPEQAAGFEPPPGWAPDAVDEVRVGVALDLPPHVYVPGSILTAQQLANALGMDEKGRYAMSPADLTPEQLGEWGLK